MPQLHETKILPHRAEDLFNLVLDVEKYPEFLPWATKSRVYRRDETSFLADLTIRYKLLNESYTSRITFERPQKIHVEYVDGPFKWMTTDWKFDPVDDYKTLVDFQIDFAVNSSLLAPIFDTFFHEASRRLLSAFEERAKVVIKKG